MYESPFIQQILFSFKYQNKKLSKGKQHDGVLTLEWVNLSTL